MLWLLLQVSRTEFLQALAAVMGGVLLFFVKRLTDGRKLV
jgi:hypothetical protein